MFKSIQLVALTIIFIFALYSYHMQINGDPEARKQCWQQGGVLWHNLDQSMVCFIINKENL